MFGSFSQSVLSQFPQMVEGYLDQGERKKTVSHHRRARFTFKLRGQNRGRGQFWHTYHWLVIVWHIYFTGYMMDPGAFLAQLLYEKMGKPGEIWYFRRVRLTACKPARSPDTGLTLCSLCAECVWGREGGTERKRVTGVNQKGSPGCRGEGVAVVGNQRKKQLHHLSYNNVPRRRCSRCFYIRECDACERHLQGTRREAVKGETL